jgi:hypothetical protein
MEVGLLMFAGGVGAGIFGSLLGLGGGILIVPLLSLGFGLPLREAVGISLICVIMTSGASAGVFLERRVANLRLGMLLELFTATGALVGGLVAFRLDERVIAGLFAALLTYVSVTMVRRSERSTVTFSTAGEGAVAEDAAAFRRQTIVERLSGPGYRVGRLVPGALGSVVAGVVSALLGVGGGIVKVPVMHLVMGVPLRVATATSNLMIGITASTGAIIYLLRGGLAPYAAGPTAVGVFVGASIGSRIAHRVDARLLRWLFVAVLLYTAFEMAQRAAGIA